MRLLIVEDEFTIARFLKDAFQKEYFAVDMVDDGDTGAHLAQVNDYDLIILDLILPKKDGLTMLREIRAGKVISPVLVLSVRSGTQQKIDLLDAGADDYLTKPFMLSELVARTRALLRRPPALASNIFTIENLTLDTRKCTVTRAGTDIHLTRKEFMLLAFLMQHEGAVLSRGMILEHVWDMNTDIFSNTIESHILSLRKKIGDTDSKRRLIQTIPGRGYRIGL